MVPYFWEIMVLENYTKLWGWLNYGKLQQIVTFYIFSMCLIVFYHILLCFIAFYQQKWPEMVQNGEKWQQKSTKVHKSSRKFMIASKRAWKGKHNEQCRLSKKSKGFFGTLVGDAWPFGTKQHTFSVSQYAHILSAGFWQNKDKHGKICNFVVWKFMANVKFTERRMVNCCKQWIALKLVWMMHEHLLTQKWCTEWSESM